jgi:hypothetical protein
VYLPGLSIHLPTDDGRETCKHAARVAFATGQRSIPTWVDRDAVDPVLGEHTSGACVAATDGGVAETTDTPDASNDGDERPSDCDCGDWNDGLELPCWPCYRDGSETPAVDDKSSEPTCHEPADFGGGDSTGVQDL